MHESDDLRSSLMLKLIYYIEERVCELEEYSTSEERSFRELVPVPQKKGLLGSWYQSLRRKVF